MRDYELTYIIKPDLDPTTSAGVIERVSGFVTADGGSITKTSPWGMRQLAYPIGRYREGQYVLSLVQIEPTSVARIEQRLRLTEDVLRFLLVRTEEEAAGEPASEDVLGGAETTEAPTAEAAEAAEAAAPVEAAPVEPAAAAPVETTAPAA
jgi:small subunit ribosomal protein S6